ncbi:MAG: hypothetical protein P8J50_08695 [Acidimicrobiales bacterium]|jgi:hypothetical protein|nr:hypothetical protein [Acidimicrobiales bacterium]
MSLRRVVMALALLAAACAPDPGVIEDTVLFDATTTTTTLSGALPPPSSPVLPPPTTVPGPGLVPPSSLPPAFSQPPDGELDPVVGRIAVEGLATTLRTPRDSIALETQGLPSQSTWSRDGSRLAVSVVTGGSTRVVSVFHGTTGALIAANDARLPYFFFSWSHDGTRIAALGPTVDGTSLDILDADGALLHENVRTAASLYVAWDPDAPRLVAHTDERLLRIDEDGTVFDLGEVGFHFFAPKWIPDSDDIVLVADIEGSETLVRRGVEGGDPLTSLGTVETLTRIAVHPDGLTAAVSITYEIEGSGATGERISLGPPLAQEAPVLSGEVDIIDLQTGERVNVFRGHALWTEWSPTGERLLIGTTDTSEGIGQWWVYEHDDPFAVPESELVLISAVGAYTPTLTFANSYLPFADQYIEQPRLWGPAGDWFVYTDSTTDGPWALAVNVDDLGEPSTVGPGAVAFWSQIG